MKDRDKSDEEGFPNIFNYYSGFQEEGPEDQLRKQFHNELTSKAWNESNKANSIADEANAYISRLKKAALVKKIQQFCFIIFGIIIIFWGIAISPVENGLVYFSNEVIGIMIAGAGIAITSGISLISFEDDIFQLLVVRCSNENQIFTEFSKIQAHLSFIENELIDLRKEKL